MYNKRHLYYFLFLLLYATSGVGIASEIKGLATLEKLNIPIYMAATSGSPPESIAAFTEQPAPFKMHARYIIGKYSARRNSQLWLNALLVGTSRTKIRNMEPAILAFKRVINHDMHRGDQLTFDIRPSEGTGILLNGEELAFIEDQNFQNSLVNSWYSDRSTSKKFAEQIRQKPNLASLKSYNSLVLDEKYKDRNKLIVAKLNKETAVNKEPSPTTQQQKKENKKNVTAKVQITKNKPVTPKPASTKKAQNTLSQKNTTSSQSASPNSQATSKSPAVDSKKVSSLEKTEGKPVDQPKRDSDESLFVSQLYDTLREDYILSAENYIQNKARPVPSMKVRRKPKGEARLKVQLRSNAEQMIVQGVEIIEGEFEDSLKKSLITSIEKLKRIPLAPEALASETFTLYVKLDFAKCKRSTSAWICF